MAGVAKWLRQWIVIPPFGGSSPLVRPQNTKVPFVSQLQAVLLLMMLIINSDQFLGNDRSRCKILNWLLLNRHSVYINSLGGICTIGSVNISAIRVTFTSFEAFYCYLGDFRN